MQEEIFAMQRGSGQPHVYAKDLAQIMVPIPEIQLQRRFAAFVEQSDKSKLFGAKHRLQHITGGYTCLAKQI